MFKLSKQNHNIKILSQFEFFLSFSMLNTIYPPNISKFVYKFLALLNSKLSCKMKGKRLNRGDGYDLEIPVIYKFDGHEKVVEI